jgi:uncharacterized protein (TIGR00725 family)
MTNATLLVSVIGAGKCDEETYAAAEQVGRALALRGATVVCGGLGGVMEAACKGAKGAGGRTIGILPGIDHTEANAYVEIPIVTGLGEARNVIVVRSGRAVVAVGGEYGTLSEIAFALKFGIPVIGLGTWQLARDARVLSGIVEASDPSEAVELAINKVRALQRD